MRSVRSHAAFSSTPGFAPKMVFAPQRAILHQKSQSLYIGDKNVYYSFFPWLILLLILLFCCIVGRAENNVALVTAIKSTKKRFMLSKAIFVDHTTPNINSEFFTIKQP